MKPIGHGFFAETKQKRKHAEAVKKYWKKERGKIILSKAARKYYRKNEEHLKERYRQYYVKKNLRAE